MTEKSEATHGKVDGGRALVGTFFLASGGALVFYILSGVSLGGTFALMVAGAVAGVVAVRRRLAPERRAELDRRWQEHLADPSKARPVDEVMAEIRRKYHSHG